MAPTLALDRRHQYDQPEVHDAARAVANVRVAAESNGAGVYEAIVTELAERRTGL